MGERQCAASLRAVIWEVGYSFCLPGDYWINVQSGQVGIALWRKGGVLRLSFKGLCVLLYSVVMHVHKGHRVTPKAFRDQSHGMNVMAQGWVSIALSISLCVTVLTHANTCSVSTRGHLYSFTHLSHCNCFPSQPPLTPKGT